MGNGLACEDLGYTRDQTWGSWWFFLALGSGELGLWGNY